ncbi:MAG: peptidoglycan-binding domain-containing protein [Planctomycetota bacterium]
MPHVKIGAGDSIPSLASTHGFLWRTIWEHPDNAALREKRDDPNLLVEGDEVFLPEREIRWEDCATEQKHRFKRLGDPIKFVLVLKRFGEPRKNERYVLEIAGQLIEGTTDGSGRLETFLPGQTKSAILVLRDGAERYPLRISRLDPVSEMTGVQQRLENLGYDCRTESGELDAPTRAALKRFQSAQDLEVTGEADDFTRAKLKELQP